MPSYTIEQVDAMLREMGRQPVPPELDTTEWALLRECAEAERHETRRRP